MRRIREIIIKTENKDGRRNKLEHKKYAIFLPVLRTVCLRRKRSEE